MATLKGESLKTLRDNLVAEEKAQKAANTAMERLKADRLKIEEEFSTSIAKTRAGASGDPSFAGAMDLKYGAKQALGSKDGDQALAQARQALKILEQLEAAGVNTYGFVGIKEELQGIALAANDLQQKQAQQNIDQIGGSIDSLKTKIDNMPKVKVGFEYSDADADTIKKLIDDLAADLKGKLTFPVNITGVAGASNSDVPDVPQFATGGLVRGPGTGTSDSIPALLSNGEYVIRAAAVRKLGKNALDLLNRGIPIPRFADGGLVGAVSSMQSSTPSRGTVNLTLPGGETYTMLAEADQFDRLLNQTARKFGRTHR
ncbi:MAG TPA: hypothetical protein DIC26_19350 [Pseudomonas sp.]|nr:hypothetical protein [Pseudomonas sp.]